MKVLLLEDDVEVRRLIATCLEMWQHEVVLAGDGVEAWEKVSSSPPDLLIADWGVPGFSGVELVRMMRQSERCRQVPILMISGRAQRELITAAVQAGVDAYLLKPFTPTQLREKIAELPAGDQAVSLGAQLKEVYSRQAGRDRGHFSPLLFFGEQAHTAEELMSPERREAAGCLLQAVGAIARCNATYPDLKLGYLIENNVFELIKQLRRHTIRWRVKAVVLSVECQGYGLMALRSIARHGREKFATWLVCSDPEKFSAEQRDELGELGITLLKRAALDQEAWRVLIQQQVVGKSPPEQPCEHLALRGGEP